MARSAGSVEARQKRAGFEGICLGVERGSVVAPYDPRFREGGAEMLIFDVIGVIGLRGAEGCVECDHGGFTAGNGVGEGFVGHQ